MLKKLEDHDFLLDRESVDKPTYIQLQDDRIAGIDHKATETEINTQASIKRMEAILSVYEDKVGQLNQLEQRIDRDIVDRVN